ncbi:MAG TPA: TraR/DksA C4-type zinc finger protein [Mycobacteriales bacterium]
MSRAALSPAEQSAVRAVLDAERRGTAEAMATLTRDFDGIVEAAASSNGDDEHDPEGATIAFERSQVAALLRQARERLGDLDRALTQLGEGTYGRCEGCGTAIAPERLAARPAARTCITCASARRR